MKYTPTKFRCYYECRKTGDQYMKSKWVLKKNLKDLREKAGLSMVALAEKTYTTNTTIFRIEKTGIVFDESLALTLSQVLEVSFEDLCLEQKHEEEALAKWERNLKAVYEVQPDEEKNYYLAFIIRQDNGKTYQVASPTYWTAMSEDGYEWRELIQYHPDGIIEQLNKFGLKCAAIHDEETLVYFYYGLEDGVLTAALIDTETVSALYPKMRTKYQIRPEEMTDCCGFCDCVSIVLREQWPHIT